MTRMAGPECAVICTLISRHTHTHTHTHTLVIEPPLGGSMRVAQNDKDDRAKLRGYVVAVVVVYLTLTDPPGIQPWSQDRRNQSKSNREHVRI